MKQLSLDVFQSGSTDPEGVLTEDYSFTPEFGAESPISYFADSNWGYKYAFSFGRFSMTSQEVGSQNVDLNTSADGYYFYAMPVGVYDFFKHKKDSSLLIGFGIGVGYLDASGDIIFTEATPQTTHAFDISEVSLAYGLFMEHEFDGWSYSVNLYGPEVSSGDYEYNLFDFGISLRKKFTY